MPPGSMADHDPSRYFFLQSKLVGRDLLGLSRNFLYDYRYGRGVLVDFGLAEREGTDSQFCMCQHTSNDRREFRAPTLAAPSVGYPKQDSRPSRRANRAGTRGFRAPEVLFKCTNQTTSRFIVPIIGVGKGSEWACVNIVHGRNRYMVCRCDTADNSFTAIPVL